MNEELKNEPIRNGTSNGHALRTEPGKPEMAAARMGEFVDATTSKMGIGAQRAAAGAQRAVDGISRAGRYLAETKPDQLGRDMSAFARKHPKTTAAVGLGLGYLIFRLLRR